MATLTERDALIASGVDRGAGEQAVESSVGSGQSPGARATRDLVQPRYAIAAALPHAGR